MRWLITPGTMVKSLRTDTYTGIVQLLNPDYKGNAHGKRHHTLVQWSPKAAVRVSSNRRKGSSNDVHVALENWTTDLSNTDVLQTCLGSVGVPQMTSQHRPVPHDNGNYCYWMPRRLSHSTNAAHSWHNRLGTYAASTSHLTNCVYE